MNFVKSKIIGYLRKALALRATPHQIAIGFAVGVFIGIFPTFGLGGLLVMAIAPLWKFNIPAAIFGTLAGNPFFAPLWIFLSCLITQINPGEIRAPQETLAQIVGHYSQIGLRYIIGTTIVSLICAIVSYFPLKYFIQRYRARKQQSV